MSNIPPPSVNADLNESPEEFNEDQNYWVLCRPNYTNGTFTPIWSLVDYPFQVPIAAPPSTQPDLGIRPIRNPPPWTEEEDKFIIKFYTKRRRELVWIQCATKLNEKFHKNEEGRTAKQCRDRWMTELKFVHSGVPRVTGRWSNQEDIQLLKLQSQFGNRWVEITRHIPGRTRMSALARFRDLIEKARVRFEMLENSVEEILPVLLQELESWEEKPFDPFRRRRD